MAGEPMSLVSQAQGVPRICLIPTHTPTAGLGTVTLPPWGLGFFILERRKMGQVSLQKDSSVIAGGIIMLTLLAI